MSESAFSTKYRLRAYRKKKVLTAFLKKLSKNQPKSAKPFIVAAQKEAWSKIDCTSCGNCCRTMTPTWKKAEVKRLATHLGMTYQEFFDKWLFIDEATGDIVNTTQPCQFFDMEKGLCGVYDLRPHDCATFPHMYRKDFFDQTEVYTANLHRCPATLVAMEALEKAMRSE